MVKEGMQGSELIIGQDGTLYHIGLKRADHPPKNIILVGDPNRVRAVSRFLKDRKEVARNREYVVDFGLYKEVPIMVMGTGIGTDNTEIASVELHAVHEFDPTAGTWDQKRPKVHMIRVGTSGSPQIDVAVGSVAISTHGIGLDNTGVYYPFISVDSVAIQFESSLRSAFETAIAKADLQKICPSAAKAIKKGGMNETQVRSYLTDSQRIYVSSASRNVVQALTEACIKLGLKHEAESNGYHVGATTSAPGFFGPQGREVGRLNILIPDLQKILSKVSIEGIRIINNEMESSALFRINHELLGYHAGSICAVVANRAGGVFASQKAYEDSVDHAIQAALEAMVILNRLEYT
jgi:uridine phosphorylase